MAHGFQSALSGSRFYQASGFAGGYDSLSPIIVQCSFQLAHIILILAILDFLGVGFPPDVPSWGNMIATSRIYITRAPWLLIFPGVAISLAVISINIVGDTLRDAFDPHAQEYIHQG